MKYRKRKRKWKNSSKNKKMMILFTIILSVITVGYASLNQVLKITGYASIDKGDGMIFTSIGMKENINAFIEQDASIKAKTLVNTQIGFETNGSITFQVSAQNQGITDAKLIGIKGLEESNIKEPSCIQVSVEDHNVGDLVYSNQVKNFTITTTSTCTSYSSKEFDLHFIYEKQETINGELPRKTIGEHTSELVNSSASGTYNYMNGTYLKGSQTSNYVWFDGFLWRIMGKNSDGNIRMITEENVTAIPFHSYRIDYLDYDNSYPNDWLNNYFYPKLEHKDLLVNSIWCSEKAEEETSARTTCTNNLSSVQKPVGLLSLDEYNLSGGKSGYLYTNQNYWTLTDDSILDGRSWYIDNPGVAIKEGMEYAIGLRPVVTIKKDVLVTGGSGIITDPFIIGDLNEVSGSLKDNSHVGEYVTYAGRNYRVVETSSSGTKLILDGYYDSNNDGTIEETDKMVYDSNYNGGCTLCTIINEDSFINWITNNNEDDKNKLVSTTWYRGDYFSNGSNYKTNLESTSNPYEGKIGLIRVGEMLSGQSETILSKNHTTSSSSSNAQTYWSANSASEYSPWYINAWGSSLYYTTKEYAIRPVILISPDVQLLGGNGTFNEPFQI